jgi:hypothetical protein
VPAVTTIQLHMLLGGLAHLHTYGILHTVDLKAGSLFVYWRELCGGGRGAQIVLHRRLSMLE